MSQPPEYLLSPYRQPEPYPIEQGLSGPGEPLMREYEWDNSTDATRITKGYKVSGDGPASRYPHHPVDPLDG